MIEDEVEGVPVVVSGRVRKIKKTKLPSVLTEHQKQRDERKKKHALVIRRCKKARAEWERCRG